MGSSPNSADEQAALLAANVLAVEMQQASRTVSQIMGVQAKQAPGECLLFAAMVRWKIVEALFVCAFYWNVVGDQVGLPIEQ